jgi:hypothetical protein
MPNHHEYRVSALAEELLCLYDEFSEFEANCAFLCDAVAALGATGSVFLEPASAGGLSLFTERVKAEASLLKEKLDEIRINVHAKKI